MNYRVNGNLGCLMLILVVVLLISLLTFFGRIIFTTPLGLVLLGYVIYVWYKRKRKTVIDQQEDVSENFTEGFSEDEAPIIDVDYEDYE